MYILRFFPDRVHAKGKSRVAPTGQTISEPQSHSTNKAQPKPQTLRESLADCKSLIQQIEFQARQPTTVNLAEPRTETNFHNYDKVATHPGIKARTGCQLKGAIQSAAQIQTEPAWPSPSSLIRLKSSLESKLESQVYPMSKQSDCATRAQQTHPASPVALPAPAPIASALPAVSPNRSSYAACRVTPPTLLPSPGCMEMISNAHYTSCYSRQLMSTRLPAASLESALSTDQNTCITSDF